MMAESDSCNAYENEEIIEGKISQPQERANIAKNKSASSLSTQRSQEPSKQSSETPVEPFNTQRNRDTLPNHDCPTQRPLRSGCRDNIECYGGLCACHDQIQSTNYFEKNNDSTSKQTTEPSSLFESLSSALPSQKEDLTGVRVSPSWISPRKVFSTIQKHGRKVAQRKHSIKPHKRYRTKLKSWKSLTCSKFKKIFRRLYRPVLVLVNVAPSQGHRARFSPLTSDCRSNTHILFKIDHFTSSILKRSKKSLLYMKTRIKQHDSSSLDWIAFTRTCRPCITTKFSRTSSIDEVMELAKSYHGRSSSKSRKLYK